MIPLQPNYDAIKSKNDDGHKGGGLSQKMTVDDGRGSQPKYDVMT